MTESVGRLAATANGQHGAFSIEQAHESGVPDHVLRGWVASGLLSPAGVRTYRAATSTKSAESQMAAFVVDIRPNIWFSFDTGAALQGFDGYVLRPPFHVTMRRGCFVERPSLIVHTSNEISPEDTTRVRGFDVMSPARTIIDLAPRTLAATADDPRRRCHP